MYGIDMGRILNMTRFVLAIGLAVLLSCSSDGGPVQHDAVISGDLTTQKQPIQELDTVNSNQHSSTGKELDISDNDFSVADTQPASDGLEGIVAYDQSIPENSFHIDYWNLPDTIESLTAVSEIVFTGRVTGYVEAVRSVPIGTEERIARLHTPSSNVHARVYDGVVFTVEEKIKGELPDNNGQITLQTWALEVDNEGKPLYRISISPIEILREGIMTRNLPDSPMYLVFANRGNPEGYYYDPRLYASLPIGVAKLKEDGTVAKAAERPLSGVIVIENEDGNLPSKRRRVTVEDIRTVAQLIAEDNTNPDTPPDDLLPANPGTKLEENPEAELFGNL